MFISYHKKIGEALQSIAILESISANLFIVFIIGKIHDETMDMKIPFFVWTQTDDTRTNLLKCLATNS
jgi:hypothetical protein